MNSIITLCICAIVVQFVTEQAKKLFNGFRSEAAPLIALFFGLLIAITTRQGIFGAFGIEIQPILTDYIITGIAYSGGAVAFNELIKLISELRPSNCPDAKTTDKS